MVERRHYFVGSGIAALAGAAFLIRDVGVRPDAITVFEREAAPGGSLDGSGDAETGYLVRGGRMFERNFVCTFDLLGSIPSADARGETLLDDLFAFNEEVRSRSECRLIRKGEPAEFNRFDLGPRNFLDLLRLLATPERRLDGRSIDQCFRPDFFATSFWIMWSTMFAFQTWHSAAELRRYCKRFVHLFPGFARLEGVLRTRFNQYDSLIAPLSDWLSAQGVRIACGVEVVAVAIERAGERRRITGLRLKRDGSETEVPIAEADRAYLTLGSMTAGSTTGANAAPPPTPVQTDWPLWSRLAARDAAFGRPDAFCSAPDRTCWCSFTATLRDPAFFDFIEALSGNKAGTGGLVTIADSPWLLSFVLFSQPHFRNQPEDAFVVWGYGLQGGRPGRATGKPMAECSGEEILAELGACLNLRDRADEMFASAIVIPCAMPLITSQFMPRRAGDRPEVRPEGAENFALIGQYVELPRDVVFTVEYSVRSAMEAVSALNEGAKRPPPVVRTDLNLAALLRAAAVLLRG